MNLTKIIDNKSYFLTLKTYRVDNLELKVIKVIQNRKRYDNFIIEGSNNGKIFIKYYCWVPKIDEIANTLNEAQIVLKHHLNSRSTADFIQTILHCYCLIYI